jgi:hypothetical protein
MCRLAASPPLQGFVTCPCPSPPADDFYLDVTAACTASSEASPPPPAGLLVVGGGQGQLPSQHPAPTQPPSHVQGEGLAQQWAQLAPDLRAGVSLAAELRAALHARLGLTISCGVARSKLAARLASPLGKPDGLAVVPDAAAVPFVRGVPLRKVPGLRCAGGWRRQCPRVGRVVAEMMCVWVDGWCVVCGGGGGGGGSQTGLAFLRPTGLGARMLFEQSSVCRGSNR